EVGGDYYDFVEVDKDTLGIAVADVSGKGVPGSLVMTMIRTALRTEARGMKDAAEVLTRVNQFISNDIKKGMFVTVFYLIIDSKRRSINYASAGHNPMILFRNSTSKTYYLNPKGFPIGIQLPEKDLFKKSIESETIELAKDDILLIYTDGITEAMNPNRELFGEERLQDVLRNNGHLPAKDFVEKLKLSIYSFTEGNQQYDDITLVAVKEQSTREADEFRRAKEAHLLIGEGQSIRDACERVNLTTYAYYNKYKKIFEEEGVDAFAVGEEASVEAKHLSIEEKTKILDIIALHPEYGAGRISEELNSERYGFEKISEGKIYDELVRSRLNTRQLREAYIQRIRSGRRRLKPPGTPLMTLDGKLIMSRQDEVESLRPLPPPLPRREAPKPEAPGDPGTPLDEFFESLMTTQPDKVVGPAASFDIEAESLLDVPLDQLLAKDRRQEAADTEAASAAGEAAPPESAQSPALEISANETFEDDSLHDMFADGQSAEPDVDFDTEKLEGVSQPAAGQDDFEESAAGVLDNLSFQDYFSESASTPDDDFDTDLDEGAKEVTLVTEEDESRLEKPIAEAAEEGDNDRHREPGISPSDEEMDETFLMSSAVDELLTGSSEGVLDEADAGDSAEVNTNGKDGSDASFADLIQAIDDEIVYITGNHKPLPAKSAKRKKSRNREAEVGNLSKSNNLLTEREKILIKGIRYYKNKEYGHAIHEFKKVLKEYPDYKEAHSILGNAYFRNQMYNEAAVSYEKVKELDPSDITAYENLGVIYANRGEYKQAVTEWKKVLELNPDRTDIKEKIKKALRMMHT
ncbi:MAG TPA: SpoIIE family protein phosphatase, partial [bacterium]